MSFKWKLVNPNMSDKLFVEKKERKKRSSLLLSALYSDQTRTVMDMLGAKRKHVSETVLCLQHFIIHSCQDDDSDLSQTNSDHHVTSLGVGA